MFPFITATLNPVGGECLHKCLYCWATGLAKRHKMQKYIGEARLFPLELAKKFTAKDFVFVCDMTDLFGHWVPKNLIQIVLDYIEKSPAQFLLLTKNPARYLEFKLPNNCVAGVTIETDTYGPQTKEITTAPEPMQRIIAMRKLKHRKMVSVEPVMYYSDDFAFKLASMEPEFIAIGYDNYNHELQEPFLCEIDDLMPILNDYHIKVYKKTMREKIFTKRDLAEIQEENTSP